jgi:hypothetical protein
MTYWAASLSSPSSFSRPGFQVNKFINMPVYQLRHVAPPHNGGQDTYHDGPPRSSP